MSRWPIELDIILCRPELRAPPPLSPQGETVVPEPEKTLFQKYWVRSSRATRTASAYGCSCTVRPYSSLSVSPDPLGLDRAHVVFFFSAFRWTRGRTREEVDALQCIYSTPALFTCSRYNVVQKLELCYKRSVLDCSCMGRASRPSSNPLITGISLNIERKLCYIHCFIHHWSTSSDLVPPTELPSVCRKADEKRKASPSDRRVHPWR